MLVGVSEAERTATGSAVQTGKTNIGPYFSGIRLKTQVLFGNDCDRFPIFVQETLKTQLAVLFVLLLVFVSQQFIQIIGDAADGEVPTRLVSPCCCSTAEYGAVDAAYQSVF